MHLFETLLLGFAWFAILGGAWLGWQLLRQNGGILLRLDELEKRLNEQEFGEDDQPKGLPIGSEAPAFELLDLSGERHWLTEFRGQPVLLIFFNPDCGFCREMAPNLAEATPHRLPVGQGENSPNPVSRIEPPDGSVGQAFQPAGAPDFPVRCSQRATGKSPAPADKNVRPTSEVHGEGGRSPGEGMPRLLILTTGDAEKNRQLFAEHETGCPVLLQSDGEVAKTYQANGTPSGYLISPDGKIASQLALGAEALLKLAGEPRRSRREEAQTEESLSRGPQSSIDQSVVAHPNGHSRENRFGNRSLARSKIKRDGLKAGTPAPDFRLPRLDGRGDLALSELRGKHVLLVFSSPGCGPCNTLAPELEKFHRSQNETIRDGQTWPSASKPLTPSDGERVAYRPGEGKIVVVMISKGEPKENRAKVKEYGLTFPIVLQQQWEISRRYAMFATPIAYWIDEDGIIAQDVAVGAEAIVDLMRQIEQSGVETKRQEPLRQTLQER